MRFSGYCVEQPWAVVNDSRVRSTADGVSAAAEPWRFDALKLVFKLGDPCDFDGQMNQTGTS